jgi:uncharacterized protein
VSAVFIDTSGLYALLDRVDLHHQEAKRTWPGIAVDSRLVTHNYVLIECAALVQRRLGIAALRSLVQDFQPLLEVEWVTEAQHRAATEALLAAGRKRLSLVDCVSFQTMRALGIRRVFCFDEHFAEQGFEVLTD